MALKLGGLAKAAHGDANRHKMKKKDPSWVNPFRVGRGENLTPSESLVAATLDEWYAAKHPKSCDEEIALVNSLKVSECPFCGSKSIAKNGRRKDGIQRYLCHACGRFFNPLTGTVFDSRRIPISEWVEYLLHLFEFHSVTTSSRDNRNAKTTGFYWLSKVFATLSGCQGGVMLEGRVWLDETFVPVDRQERVTRGGKRLRGLSRNLIAIGVAASENGMYAVVEWASKPSKKRTFELFKGHIRPGSTLVHDGDNSHSKLIKELGLVSEVHPTKETKGLDDKNNPMDMVNNIHGLLKRFLREHGGYARDHLQGWVDLFWFIWSDPPSRYEKVAVFFQKAVLGKKVIRYRSLFRKKKR